MRVHVIAVGKVKGALAELATEYERRARHYWSLTVDEVRAGSSSGTSHDVQRDEAERLLGFCDNASLIWLLTREGKALTSAGLSQRLADRALHSESEIAVLVGGAFGFSPALRDRADASLSLSALTLPHELARVVLLEQLYRAGTILRGEPYHKGPNS